MAFADASNKPELPAASQTKALARRALAQARQEGQGAEWRRAVELFREKDADGNRLGLLPYTPAGVQALEQLLVKNPENYDALHNLAIAHHCHAWDLELANNPEAITEWIQALECWRKIGTNREFWEARKARYLRCAGNGANPVWLDILRRELLDQLLDIHADFICYYSQMGTPERAAAHVDLVKRAKVPPVSRERLLAKVMGEMTGNVPEMRARHAYQEALDTVDHFLAMFPDYLPALRLYMEVGEQWLEALSYQKDWPVILEISAQGQIHAAHFANHTGAKEEPLGKSVFLALGWQFCRLAFKRGAAYGDASAGLSQSEAIEAFQLGVEWGRLVCPMSVQNAPVRKHFAECAKGWAKMQHDAAVEMLQTKGGPAKPAVVAIFNDILMLLREAVTISPENAKILQDNFIRPVEEELTMINDF